VLHWLEWRGGVEWPAKRLRAAAAAAPWIQLGGVEWRLTRAPPCDRVCATASFPLGATYRDHVRAWGREYRKHELATDLRWRELNGTR
jgi:hypothetical protein